MDTDPGAAACVPARTQAEEREYTSQQRAALVAWHLAHGEGMTTANVAELADLTRQGAYALLELLSVVLPIYQNGKGVWQASALLEP